MMKLLRKIAILCALGGCLAGCRKPPSESVAETLNPAAIVGTYRGIPDQGATAREASLELRQDSSATLRVDDGGQAANAWQGRWSSIPPLVRFDFDPVSGRRLDSITWKLSGEELVPFTWDQKRYGPQGLPLRRAR